MILMIILTCCTKYFKWIFTISIHADVGIGRDLTADFLDFIMFLADAKGHEQISFNYIIAYNRNYIYYARQTIFQKLFPIQIKLLIKNIKLMKEEANLLNYLSNKNTPTSSQHVQTPSRRGGLQSQYPSIKSQYTTNYQSNIVNKSVRNYRQDIHFITNLQQPNEYIAYCIVQKDSNLGVYSHERLLILDSFRKELKYYSQIPTLPIQNLQSLTVEPKEIIKLQTTKKFSYIFAQNGMGQVSITWVNQQGKSKEWKLTMNSRRIAKQFGILIQQVKKGEAIKQGKIVVSNESTKMIQHKVNKKQTPFISQLKKLQENKKKQSTRKISEIKAQEIINNGSEIVLTLPHKKLQREKVIQTKESKPSQNIQKTEQIKILSKEKALDQAQKQTSPIIPPQDILAVKKDIIEPIFIVTKPQEAPPKSITKKPLQIKIEEGTKVLQIKSPNSQNKRFHQLQNILNSAKTQQKKNRSSLNSPMDSEKRSTIKKNASLENSRKRQASQAKEGLVSKQPAYQQKYKSFRMSLLQQRRHNINASSINKTQPKRQSIRKSSSIHQHSKNQSWLAKWLMGNTKQDLASIYCKFIAECQAKVKKMTSKFDHWHLLHKTGDEFQFQEDQIEFKYYVFQENSDHAFLFKKQSELVHKIRNWSYLLQFVKKQSYQNIRFAVPLACIVTHKGLKVFCKASFNSMKADSVVIEGLTEYIKPLKEIQKQCKVSLLRCELFKINLQDISFAYFNQLDSLPRIKEAQFIDCNYLQKFIEQGIISNQFDIEQISKHLKNKIFHRFLKKLNSSYLLTSIELEQILNQYGLNKSFLSSIYHIAKQNLYQQAASILEGECISMAMQKIIRLSIHRYIMNQHKNDIETIVFNSLNMFLQRNLILLQEIKKHVDDIFNRQTQIYSNKLNYGYIVSSTLLKLSLRCQFRYKVPFEQLQNLQQQIWPKISFNNDSTNLFITCDTVCYSYKNFINSKLLQENVFDKIHLGEGMTKQKIISQINPFQYASYFDSDTFKLLPSNNKIKLNYYLAHFTPPDNRSLGLLFDYQFKEAYFNLYQHSTAYIQTQQSFSQDLTGIKWLIKKKKYEEAQSKIQEQRQRVWIWARHHPKIMLQIHDLQAYYAQSRGNYKIVNQRSLMSLQLAIHFFRLKTDETWQIIWEKAFFTAEVHYQSDKFQQANSFFQICENLSERIKFQQVKTSQINQKFLEVYNKQARIKLAQGQIQQCIQCLKINILKLQQWRSFFQNQKLRPNIILKIGCELYETYFLLLRCYEIKNNFAMFGSTLQLVSLQYFQKDWNEQYLIDPKFKLSSTNKYRFNQLIKGFWIYIVKDIDQINKHLSLSSESTINLAMIGDYIQAIKLQNHGYYRYTSQQLYKYIVELTINHNKSKEIPQKSSILAVIIDCLSNLSSGIRHKRCKLYDQDNKYNKLLLLQSLTNLTSYQFCWGIIQEHLKNYSFSI